MDLSQRGGVPSSPRDCCPFLVVDTVALSDRAGWLLGYVLSPPPLRRDRRPGVSTWQPASLTALPLVFNLASSGQQEIHPPLLIGKKSPRPGASV